VSHGGHGHHRRVDPVDEFGKAPRGLGAERLPHALRFDRIEIEGATFETIVSRAAVEGLQCSGYNSNPSQRLELQGAPKFKGVCGPMWDGDAIRYECSATYAELSA